MARHVLLDMQSVMRRRQRPRVVAMCREICECVGAVRQCLYSYGISYIFKVRGGLNNRRLLPNNTYI